MKIDITSLCFGFKIEKDNDSGTAAWATSIGQAPKDICYIDTNREGLDEIVYGMMYKSHSDFENLKVRNVIGLDKREEPRGDRERMMFSVFEDVYVNGMKVDGIYTLTYEREDTPSHKNRLHICYAKYLTYDGHSNKDTLKEMAKKLGCSEDACWFVTDITIRDQKSLHFTAIVVNPEHSMTYLNSKERKRAWEELIPEEDNNNHYQIDEPLQQIFYGAPGTGKSNTIKCEVDQKDLPRVRTTFHPDSDYSTFVGAYKPTSVEVPMMTMIGTKAVPVENPDGTPRKEKKIVYEFVPQAFLKAYTGAWKNQDEPFFLIIEEINRGNCAQIFGDLFQLLDRNDETGLSDYPISPDEDIQKFLLTDKKYGFAALTEEQKAAIPEEVLSGELMILPHNLHIWATMNTSDQSLFPIDSAFKRRWDWQYMPISDGKKGWQIAANGKRYDWWQFLQKMNDKIGTATNSEDKKLGYFFCKAKNGVIDAETFVGKVVFYIWNDVFKDFAEEAGDLFKDDDVDSPLLSFNKFYTVGIDGKTKVVEQKVELLLQNLGVEEVDDVEYVEDEDVDENLSDEARSSNNRLHVTFPDGETIRIQTGKEYVDVIKKIGLDKAYDVAQSRDPSILKCAFVTKEKEDAIENSTYLRYETIGEYHVVRGMSGDTMRPFLEKISNQYNLGLKFYRQ